MKRPEKLTRHLHDCRRRGVMLLYAIIMIGLVGLSMTILNSMMLSISTQYRMTENRVAKQNLHLSLIALRQVSTDHALFDNDHVVIDASQFLFREPPRLLVTTYLSQHERKVSISGAEIIIEKVKDPVSLPAPAEPFKLSTKPEMVSTPIRQDPNSID